jgi:hypothetical protein
MEKEFEWRQSKDVAYLRFVCYMERNGTLPLVFLKKYTLTLKNIYDKEALWTAENLKN